MGRRDDAFTGIFCGAYLDTHTTIAWDVKRNFKSSSSLVRLLLTQTCRLFLYQVAFMMFITKFHEEMMFISLPSCFGEVLRTIRLRHALNVNMW